MAKPEAKIEYTPDGGVVIDFDKPPPGKNWSIENGGVVTWIDNDDFESWSIENGTVEATLINSAEEPNDGTN